MEKKPNRCKVPALEDLEEVNSKVPQLNVDQKQYEFVLYYLKESNQNRKIEWIFVMFHKPMYASISKQL